jgi:hypothetical protein
MKTENPRFFSLPVTGASSSFYNSAKFPLGDLGCNLPRHAFPLPHQVSTPDDFPLLNGAFQTCTDHHTSTRRFPRCAGTSSGIFGLVPCETPRPFNCLWPFRRRGSLASTRNEAQQLPLHTSGSRDAHEVPSKF